MLIPFLRNAFGNVHSEAEAAKSGVGDVGPIKFIKDSFDLIFAHSESVIFYTDFNLDVLSLAANLYLSPFGEYLMALLSRLSIT